MKRGLKRIFSSFLAVALLIGSVSCFSIAADTANDNTVRDKQYGIEPAETIGDVPTEFRDFVTNNKAVGRDSVTDKGCYTFEPDKKSYTVTRTRLSGEADLSVNYKYRYADEETVSILSPVVSRNAVFDDNLSGNLYFTSSVQKFKSLFFISWVSNTKPIVVKCDKEGNVLWQKTFRPKQMFFIKTVTELPNGNVLVEGYKKVATFYKDFYSDVLKSAVIVLSEDGKVISNKEYDDTIFLSNIAYIDGRGFMLTVMVREKTDDEYLRNYYLCAVSEDFELIWKKSISEKSVENINSKTVAEYGYPVFTKNDDKYSVDSRNEQLLKIDFDNHIIGQISCKAPKGSYISNAFALKNGGIIVETDIDVNGNKAYPNKFTAELYDKSCQKVKKLDITGYSIYSIIETDKSEVIVSWNNKSFGENDDGVREAVYAGFNKSFEKVWQRGIEE